MSRFRRAPKAKAPRRTLPPPGVIRRERRNVERLRDEKLRDLGGLMLEMYRRDTFREDLLADRCNELLGLDARLHELDEMLAASRRRDPGRPLRLRRPAAVGLHFCPNCGRPAGQTIVACPECEHPLPGDARFCANCGAADGDAEGEAEARARRQAEPGRPQPAPPTAKTRRSLSLPRVRDTRRARPGVLPRLRRPDRPRPAFQQLRACLGTADRALPRRLDWRPSCSWARRRGLGDRWHRRRARHRARRAAHGRWSRPHPSFPRHRRLRPQTEPTTTAPATKPATKPKPTPKPAKPSPPGRRATATRSCSPRSRPAARGSPRRRKGEAGALGRLAGRRRARLLEIRKPPPRLLRRLRRNLRLARRGPDSRPGVVRPVSERVRPPGHCVRGRCSPPARRGDQSKHETWPFAGMATFVTGPGKE